jgi:hypothetical protein
MSQSRSHPINGPTTARITLVISHLKWRAAPQLCTLACTFIAHPKVNVDGSAPCRQHHGMWGVDIRSNRANSIRLLVSALVTLLADA